MNNIKNASVRMLEIAYQALDEKKALDIHMIDISQISILADYFIISSGSNPNQIHAMADRVEEKMKEAGFYPRAVEGYQNANWILMDYQDVVIHIFDQESRDFYDIERIWSDAERIDQNSLSTPNTLPKMST